MLKLVNYMYKNSDKNLDDALSQLFPSIKTKKTVMDDFDGIAPSPIAVQSADIPFMQSVESLLEFKNPNKNEVNYFDAIRTRSRGKEVFLHGGNNS